MNVLSNSFKSFTVCVCNLSIEQKNDKENRHCDKNCMSNKKYNVYIMSKNI